MFNTASSAHRCSTGLASDSVSTFYDHPKTEKWRAATGKVVWLRLWIFQERGEKFFKWRGGGIIDVGTRVAVA